MKIWLSKLAVNLCNNIKANKTRESGNILLRWTEVIRWTEKMQFQKAADRKLNYISTTQCNGTKLLDNIILLMRLKTCLSGVLCITINLMWLAKTKKTGNLKQTKSIKYIRFSSEKLKIKNLKHHRFQQITTKFKNDITKRNIAKMIRHCSSYTHAHAHTTSMVMIYFITTFYEI